MPPVSTCSKFWKSEYFCDKCGKSLNSYRSCISFNNYLMSKLFLSKSLSYRVICQRSFPFEILKLTIPVASNAQNFLIKRSLPQTDLTFSNITMHFQDKWERSRWYFWQTLHMYNILAWQIEIISRNKQGRLV